MLTIVLKDETVSTCGRAHGGALAQHEADRLSPSKVIIFSSYYVWRRLALSSMRNCGKAWLSFLRTRGSGSDVGCSTRAAAMASPGQALKSVVNSAGKTSNYFINLLMKIAINPNKKALINAVSSCYFCVLLQSASRC
ncbi:hypothetical protein AB3M75_22335 [Serratia ureilytica]|uniref:hypothetical protein n=1 Tax=Serratia ureilytica TaxID=300181 RepID=UPI00371D9934